MFYHHGLAPCHARVLHIRCDRLGLVSPVPLPTGLGCKTEERVRIHVQNWGSGCGITLVTRGGSCHVEASFKGIMDEGPESDPSLVRRIAKARSIGL